MSALESRIDQLYKLPLPEFVPARAVLAQTLSSADARRVKALKKPTLVPWAVNQFYWHARPFYERLMKTGRTLRAAQVSALKGRRVDVRGATASHRKAIADAVKEAARLASLIHMHPSDEHLARMFEAVSLLPNQQTPPGRWTTTLQPQGFEALAGLAVKPASRPGAASPPTLLAAAPSVDHARQARREHEQAVADRRKRAAMQEAEAALRRATTAELRAREAWARAKQDLQNAEQALAALTTT